MSVGTGSLKRTAKSVAAPKEETVMPEAKQEINGSGAVKPKETETRSLKSKEEAKTKKAGTRTSSAKTSTAKKPAAETSAVKKTVSKTAAKKAAAPKAEAEAESAAEAAMAVPSEQGELASGIKCDIPVYLL